MPNEVKKVIAIIDNPDYPDYIDYPDYPDYPYDPDDPAKEYVLLFSSRLNKNPIIWSKL